MLQEREQISAFPQAGVYAVVFSLASFTYNSNIALKA
jgi:hypothetical protein